MSETNQSRTASPTISQTRVGVDFNPSGDGAAAIALFDPVRLRELGEPGIDLLIEAVRCRDIAEQAAEDAAMWAVKGAAGSSPRVRGTRRRPQPQPARGPSPRVRGTRLISLKCIRHHRSRKCQVSTPYTAPHRITSKYRCVVLSGTCRKRDKSN